MLSFVWSVLILLAHLAVVTSIVVFERRRPAATLAWLLTLAFMPGVGLVLYAVFGRTRARREARRYAHVLQRVGALLEKFDVHGKLAARGSETLSPLADILLRLGNRVTSTRASLGNRAEILHDAEATYAAMMAAVEDAEDHVHVEFYIVRADETGRRMRDVLARRAREGVEVRVVCDGLGSGHLPGGFWDPLVEAGGEASYFQPVSRILTRIPWRDRLDFRNHRKLVIVDGRVGFTGGINVGREYLGLNPQIGYWRDTHVRLEGPAVLGLQKVFGEDWLQASGRLLDDERYFPPPRPEREGRCAVQIVDSGPDKTYSSISLIFVQAFALARERLWITNPYFIPDPPVEQGLIAAALRGVDVRLLVPLESDAKVVMLASSSYFGVLLEAGVRVFRYERGFLHAKTMVVDDWAATIGSANMDMRSFHLNYELNAFVYSRDFGRQLAEQFLADQRHALELDRDYERSLRLPARVLQAGARILSPIL